MDTGFFGISFFELLVIAAIALVVVGPDHIPEYARKLGKLVRDFRKMTSNLSSEMTKAMDLNNEADDLKKTALSVSSILSEEARSISSSLDAEASEISKTMGIEVADIKKTLAESTDELGAILKKEAATMKQSADEVRGALDREVGELTKTFSDGKKKLDNLLGVEQKTAAPAATAAASEQPAAVDAPAKPMAATAVKEAEKTAPAAQPANPGPQSGG